MQPRLCSCSTCPRLTHQWSAANKLVVDKGALRAAEALLQPLLT